MNTVLDENHDERWDAVQDGAELLREGQISQAITQLEKVLSGDEANEYAYYFLGAAHFENGEFVKAMKNYLRAVEFSPHYLGALVGLGQSLRMLGRHDEAIRVAKQILTLQEEDADALYLLGLCHFARGDRDQAQKYLTRFLETRPEPETALEIEGMLQVLRGEVIPLHPQDGELN